MDVKDGKPPVRPYRKRVTNILDLIKEIKNLKRLLKIVKKHVSYDAALYEEINEAIKK